MSRFVSVVILVCLAHGALQAQRGGRSGSSPRTVPDQGASYGVGPAAPPPTSSGSRYHAGDEGPVEFRSETILVQVPVIVTDKSGGHARGLTKEDFRILEDGKEQKITSFEEIQATPVALAQSAGHEGEFSNLNLGHAKATAVTVIALDMINTPFMDQAYGRKELIKFLADHVEAGQQPIGLVSINSKGLRVINGLSSDPAVLVAALKKVRGEIPAMQGVDADAQAQAAGGVDPTSSAVETAAAGGGLAMPNVVSAGGSMGVDLALREFILNADANILRMQQDHAIEITLRAFLDIAQSLSGIPGKKALIWATGGFPFIMDNLSAVPGGYLTLLYEHAMQALNDAEVSIYPVDVRGLVNTSAVSDAKYSGGLTGPAFTRSQTLRSWLHNTTLDTLSDVAEITGGRAFFNSNDVAGGFKKAADDSAQYYVVGYHLDTKNTKAGWRTLKVKVKKPNTEVRAREGFFITNATTNPAASRQLDVESALVSPFDSTGIPMTVSWRGVSPSGDKRKVDFNIHLQGGGIFIDEPHNNHFNIEFDAVAFKKGTSAGTFGKAMESSIKPESLESVKATGVGYHDSLELAPGQYTVRFVVRDNLTGRLGSVSAPLTVN